LGNFPCKVLLNGKQKYGPVYRVKFGSFRTVVLNDTKSVKAAFRLAAFSDRPPLKQYKDGTEDNGLDIIFGYELLTLVKNCDLECYKCGIL
ncbi:unnamed protein product, partial [Allacma fusca]